jgi:hypothetical protein
MNVKKMYKACSLVQFVHCKKNLKALPYVLGTSVADPLHSGVDPDPDPRIHASD